MFYWVYFIYLSLKVLVIFFIFLFVSHFLTSTISMWLVMIDLYFNLLFILLDHCLFSCLYTILIRYRRLRGICFILFLIIFMWILDCFIQGYGVFFDLGFSFIIFMNFVMIVQAICCSCFKLVILELISLSFWNLCLTFKVIFYLLIYLLTASNQLFISKYVHKSMRRKTLPI